MHNVIKLELTEQEFNTIRDIVNSRKLELATTAQRFTKVVNDHMQIGSPCISNDEITQAEFAVRRCSTLERELTPILEKFSKAILV